MALSILPITPFVTTGSPLSSSATILCGGNAAPSRHLASNNHLLINNTSSRPPGIFPILHGMRNRWNQTLWLLAGLQIGLRKVCHSPDGPVPHRS